MLLVALSFIIQIVVISYNHLTGYVIVDSWIHFLQWLVENTIISTVAGTVVVLCDLMIIRLLNFKYKWTESVIKRVVVQLILTIFSAVIISTATTLINHNFIHRYHENLTEVLIINAIIITVVNVMLMTILEGWIFFKENKKANAVTGNLKYELSQVKFDILKSQINPHFMFNSLNILSGLIKKDTDKAQRFIEDFSDVYRYVAETIERPLVSLKMELDFVESYLYLQKIRYGNLLTYTADVDKHLYDYQLPPLSLQVILENAIKHNIITEASALIIEINSENECLVIKNKIAPKLSYEISSGTGLSNLTKRYAFVCNKHPEFKKSGGYFIASLPLIN